MNRPSKLFIAVITPVLIALVFAADYLTGTEISLSILYLVPVSAVTWRFGGTAGFITSLISAAAWFIDDNLHGHEYSHFLIPYWNASVRFGFYIIVVFVLSRLRRAMDAEARLARTDFLTGLPNMKNFYEQAENARRKSMSSSLPLTVVYIDCDNFKEINDREGHVTGNEVLRRVAEVLRDNLRPEDIVSRFGGDEFAILLPATDESSAKHVISRLREKLLFAMSESGWPVTFSMGMATYLDPPASLEEMIRKADDLMYEVKAKGKNSILQFTQERTNPDPSA